MEVVIKISDKDYQLMKDGHIPFNVLDKMMNGTPLPKGHGRIADIDALREEMKATRTFDILFALDRTRPIIEADTESEE